MSVYYKFAAWLICPTKFLCGMFSSSVSAGKSCPSGSYKSIEWLATAEVRVGSSRMPHGGYADPVMNDGPGFYLNISSKNSLDLSLMPSR